MKQNFGFIPDRAARKEYMRSTPRPFFGDYSLGENLGRGKSGRLAPIYEEVTDGPLVPHYQKRGTCVGEGYTLGTEFLTCAEIHAGEREEWRGKYSVEATYALSRVEIGGRKLGRNEDGSNGSWAAKALTTFGVLLRAKYGKYDLTERRDDLAVTWGYDGLPDELEVLAKEHPIKTTALVMSYDEAIDALARGCPVPVCSNYGFTMERDKDGFCTPRGTWYHCMVLAGWDDESRRPGVECFNSWGDYLKGGEHRLGVAPGAFWIDADVIDKMLRQGDSFALSGFEGFPIRALNYHDWV